MNTLSEFNLMDAETQSCPYAFYAALRREAPIYKMPETGFYLVSKYQDIREVMRQPEVYSSELEFRDMVPGGLNPEIPKIYKEHGWEQVQTLVFRDPPTHTRQRAMVEYGFRAGRVGKMEPYIDGVVNDLIDGFISEGGEPGTHQRRY